jgi:hypothetical protein
MTDTLATVARLRQAYADCRLRDEARSIAVKDLAAAARQLGRQPANMKMGRVLLVGIIEMAFLASDGSGK